YINTRYSLYILSNSYRDPRDLHSFPTRRSSDLIQRNQSAAFSSGKVRPNHETNMNIIARRTGKDVNSHTVLDGIITTIMDCVTIDRKSGSAGMPRPISYAVFCLKKKKKSK